MEKDSNYTLYGIIAVIE